MTEKHQSGRAQGRLGARRGSVRVDVRRGLQGIELERFRKALEDFRAGRLSEAEKRLNEIIGGEPAAPQPYHLAGVIALGRGKLAEAKRSFSAAIRFSSLGEEAAAAWVGLGRAELPLGDANRALACFDRAEQLHPGFAPAKSGQAAVWCEIGDYVHAESCARSALALGEDAQTRLILARSLLFQSRMDEAEELLQGLVSRAETSFLARMHLAGIAYARGRLEEAENSFRALLREQPLHPCYTEFAKTKHFSSEDDPDLCNMRQILSGMPADTGRASALLRADLSFALAKAYDDLSLPDPAFSHLRTGNSLRSREDPFDVQAFADHAETAVKLTRSVPAAELHDWPADTPASPLLIAALPRSGSSLLEQMLGGHPAIRPGGEFSTILPVLADAVKRASGEISKADTGESSRRAEWRAAKRKILETLSKEEAGIGYVSEKSPIGFLYLGPMAALLPRAKFIHLQRHPLDMALSQYMQNFVRGSGWSYDLDTIAEYYRAYERVMERWNDLLGPRILNVRYEALVHDPDRQLRTIFAFCGLDFPREGSRLESRRQPVWTASGFQVRQPINAGSVGKWRRYEKYLAPLARRLHDSVLRYEEALESEGIPFNRGERRRGEDGQAG